MVLFQECKCTYFSVCLNLTAFWSLILQLLYAHRPPDDHHPRNRAYSSSDVQENMSPESMKLNVGISSNGDVDVAEISLADMDPEDIRVSMRIVEGFLRHLIYKLFVFKFRSIVLGIFLSKK